jgi:hypothetical protein
LLWWYFKGGPLHIGLILANVKLLLILELVLLVHLPHLIDFVKVDNKTSFVGVLFFYTLPAKNSSMIRTIKMLNTLIVILTE